MVLLRLEDLISVFGEDSSEIKEIITSLKINQNPEKVVKQPLVEGINPKKIKVNTDTYIQNGNGIPRNDIGATYHLGVKEGQIHPRILTVGSPQRARIIARLLQNPVEIESSRLMLTISGLYKNTPVSICACLMGAPNFDMFFREASNVLQDTPIAMIRLGTCGINSSLISPGTVLLATRGSIYNFKNYLYFDGASFASQEGVVKGGPYLYSAPVQGDKSLHEGLRKSLERKGVSGERVKEGLNACGECFYSTQGRVDPLVDDENEGVLDDFDRLGVDFIDMETHQLFHLAKMRKVRCYAASCCVGIVNRKMPELAVSGPLLHEMELKVGEAILDTLVEFSL